MPFDIKEFLFKHVEKAILGIIAVLVIIGLLPPAGDKLNVGQVDSMISQIEQNVRTAESKARQTPVRPRDMISETIRNWFELYKGFNVALSDKSYMTVDQKEYDREKVTAVAKGMGKGWAKIYPPEKLVAKPYRGFIKLEIYLNPEQERLLASKKMTVGDFLTGYLIFRKREGDEEGRWIQIIEKPHKLVPNRDLSVAAPLPVAPVPGRTGPERVPPGTMRGGGPSSTAPVGGGAATPEEVMRLYRTGKMTREMQERIFGGGPAGPMGPGTGGQMPGGGPYQPGAPGTPYKRPEDFMQRTVYMFVDKNVDPDESYSYKARFVADLKDPDLPEKERILESGLSDATPYKKILDEIEFYIRGGTEELVVIPIRKWRTIEGRRAASEKERLKAEAADVKIRSDSSAEDAGDFDIPMYGGEWVEATFQVKKGEKIGRVEEIYKKDAYGKMQSYKVDFFTGCTLVDAKYAIHLEKKVTKENVFDNAGRIIGDVVVEKRLTSEKLQIVYLDRKGNLKSMWQGAPRRERRLGPSRTAPQRTRGSGRTPGVPPGAVGPGGVPYPVPGAGGTTTRKTRRR